MLMWLNSSVQAAWESVEGVDLLIDVKPFLSWASEGTRRSGTITAAQLGNCL